MDGVRSTGTKKWQRATLAKSAARHRSEPCGDHRATSRVAWPQFHAPPRQTRPHRKHTPFSALCFLISRGERHGPPPAEAHPPGSARPESPSSGPSPRPLSEDRVQGRHLAPLRGGLPRALRLVSPHTQRVERVHPRSESLAGGRRHLSRPRSTRTWRATREPRAQGSPLLFGRRPSGSRWKLAEGGAAVAPTNSVVLSAPRTWAWDPGHHDTREVPLRLGESRSSRACRSRLPWPTLGPGLPATGEGTCGVLPARRIPRTRCRENRAKRPLPRSRLQPRHRCGVREDTARPGAGALRPPGAQPARQDGHPLTPAGNRGDRLAGAQFSPELGSSASRAKRAQLRSPPSALGAGWVGFICKRRRGGL